MFHFSMVLSTAIRSLLHSSCCTPQR